MLRDMVGSFSGSHICVCVPTYKRPQMLEGLLTKLQGQKTEGLFTYSVLVVDNDREQSAKRVIKSCRKRTVIPIEYHIEPEANIAMARNKAIQSANGDFVAFIDDDEFPDNDWLLNLYKTCLQYKADGVLGPVVPDFKTTPPKWVVKGKFCERPSYETGTVIHWRNSRSGNVLLKGSLFQPGVPAFNPKFQIQGEDVQFFKKMNEQGYVFVWCKEASVYEVVTYSRCRKSYFLRRAFVQGNASLQYHNRLYLGQKLHIFMKSAAASVLYTCMLPFCYFAGVHVFMKYLIKDVHHISRLLGLFHLSSVKERGF